MHAHTRPSGVYFYCYICLVSNVVREEWSLTYSLVHQPLWHTRNKIFCQVSQQIIIVDSCLSFRN